MEDRGLFCWDRLLWGMYTRKKKHEARQNYVVKGALFVFLGIYSFVGDNVEEPEMDENVACTGKGLYRILFGNLAGRGLGVGEIILI